MKMLEVKGWVETKECLRERQVGVDPNRQCMRWSIAPSQIIGLSDGGSVCRIMLPGLILNVEKPLKEIQAAIDACEETETLDNSSEDFEELFFRDLRAMTLAFLAVFAIAFGVIGSISLGFGLLFVPKHAVGIALLFTGTSLGLFSLRLILQANSKIARASKKPVEKVTDSPDSQPLYRNE